VKKKIILGFTIFSLLIVAALFLTSKISDAYKTANRKILNDPTIGQEYGMQQYTVLVGSSFKLGPEWSCASLVFFVKGANSVGFVNVKLRRKKIYRDAWDVLDLTTGFYTRSEVSCGPTA
jgi:hypothetical protein